MERRERKQQVSLYFSSLFTVDFFSALSTEQQKYSQLRNRAPELTEIIVPLAAHLLTNAAL